MQLSILLCALVALTACATPLVASNPKTVKLISQNNSEENLKDDLEVIRFRRAARDSSEESSEAQGMNGMNDMKTFMKIAEKMFNSDRFSNSKGMRGRVSEVAKLLLQLMKLFENYLSTSNNIDD